VDQTERLWGEEQDARRWITAAGEDVDDHRGREHPAIQGFPTGCFDGWQPVLSDTAEDRHHLPVAIIQCLQLASDRRKRRRHSAPTDSVG
jgi:hypothetical protein|tara:strand:- start:430 stop:699 length:270 start_codon:yes stop_codon:yes gene_type:complete